MEISLRDNQRGQAIVEYLLVLVVSVGIILGGIYQLNSAFKSWANNYFGNYLACLLETGELPTISGNPGDSGVCNQLFKPFSLADGRPLLNKTDPSESKPAKGSGGGTRERRGGGYAGGGGGSYSGGPAFKGGIGPRGGFGGGKGGGKQVSSTYTGSTATSGSGGYSSSRNRVGGKNRELLNTRFAFEDGRERNRKRSVASVPTKSSEIGGARTKFKLRVPQAKKDVAEGPSSGFTVANFIRFLIIAAIIIAIVLFLGGQALQIGKSMDGG